MMELSAHNTGGVSKICIGMNHPFLKKICSFLIHILRKGVSLRINHVNHNANIVPVGHSINGADHEKKTYSYEQNQKWQ